MWEVWLILYHEKGIRLQMFTKIFFLINDILNQGSAVPYGNQPFNSNPDLIMKIAL